MKILLIGGPIDGKTINIPKDSITRQSWRIYIPDPNNCDHILLYKVHIVDGQIVMSKGSIIFDYCQTLHKFYGEVNT